MLANPNDPRVIGKMPDGKPIFIIPKDLILTPDQTLELGDNISATKRYAIVEDLSKKVLLRAAQFIEQTFVNTAPPRAMNAFNSGNAALLVVMTRKCGYEAIQDGLKTIVKVKGKVIREMIAHVDNRFSDDVARRVNVIIKMPSN